MEFHPRRRGQRALINITSLIDVMFLLLIFLMVSSTFKDQPAINLVLPRSSSAEDAPLTPSILFLTAEGEIYLDARRYAEEDLGPALRQLRASSGEDRLILRADQSSAHGDVVRLIDLVKTSGFTRVSLSARRER
jgi:biopolymer transport protein ExbD